MKLTPRRLLAAVAAGALLVAPIATAAQAATPKYPATFTHTRLILDPIANGYTGSMSVTVTWQGAEATPNLSLSIAEPIANSFRSIDPSSPCWFNYGADNRRTIGCGLEGGAFQPGETRTFTVLFTAYTPPQIQPMVATGGQISVIDGVLGPVSKVKAFDTTLRGTNGKLKDPTPYVQDTASDITLTAGSSVTLTRQPDGTFLGRLPMTVSWYGDSPNYGAWIDIPLPEGWYTPDTDPSSQDMCWQGCSAPGGPFVDGDVRTFDMLFHAPEDAVVGSTGTVTARIVARWGFDEMPDVTPADNAVTFTYTVA